MIELDGERNRTNWSGNTCFQGCQQPTHGTLLSSKHHLAASYREEQQDLFQVMFGINGTEQPGRRQLISREDASQQAAAGFQVGQVDINNGEHAKMSGLVSGLP